MKLQFIACKVMQREADFCAARSKNSIDMVFMEQGLHLEPEKLRTEVQKALDITEDSKGISYDASLLGYGLCSNGIVGLNAKIPIVVPRGHDCVTLLLGSKEKYKQYFETHKGVYWYSPGWIEHGDQPSKQKYERLLEQYQQKFGADNAKYLMETEQDWMNKYNWATYIDWGFDCSEQDKKFTKKCAEYLGWNYDELKADPSLMQQLLDGNWPEDKFLIIKPGQKITEDLTNQGIINAE